MVDTCYVRLRSIVQVACALSVVLGGLAAFAATAAATEEPLAGYWGTDAAGLIRRSGDAPDHGDLRGVHLNAPIVGIAAMPNGRGFWLAAADGGVFSFGGARFLGSAANLHLNAPIVGIAASWNDGYWLVAADGGVFTFGNAKFMGSAGNLHLNAPIVGIARGVRGGYRLAASDGGVFTFGGAAFFGSAGNLHLNAPIVGIASQVNFAATDGYVLAASDGGVFIYGTAGFSGTSSRSPISAIASSPFSGYVLQSSNGGSLSAFGNASSCSEPAGTGHDPTRSRFVGVAAAFRSDRGDIEGAMANVSCPVGGGHTGAFHGRKRWHVDVGKTSGDTGPACFTEVFALDRVGNQPVPTRPLVAKYGSIQMRTTQMAGHSAFDVRVTGTNCRAVVTRSFFQIFLLPLKATTRVGDIGPFWATDQSPASFTLKAHGTCTTEVRDDGDGRLLSRKAGT
ncbi:MAG: hypothetical protein QOI44_449, partial [Actinomycetota bacterium]|nr:hypothetical protein [Actinomycetota bacterium]